MAGQRDQDRWKPNQESQSDSERRPWEGYRRQTRQAPDYGSAGGQYTSRVGPDQNPYTEDEGAYAGVRNRSYSGQGNYNPGIERDWEREGRGSAGGYGQVGGRRQQARDEGGYSRGSRQDGDRFYGQGGAMAKPFPAIRVTRPAGLARPRATIRNIMTGVRSRSENMTKTTARGARAR